MILSSGKLNKKITALMFSLILSVNLSAQSANNLSLQSQQVLLPKKVYIGDQAELRCTFSTQSDLSSLLEQKELSASGFLSGTDYDEYEIKQLTLLQAGPGHYMFVITFIPWKTGLIRFPSYRLMEEGNLVLKFEDINISLLSEGDNAGFRDQLPPLLLPGTSYKIYGVIIAVVLFFSVLIRLLIKHDDVALALENRKLIRKYKRNKKHTIKALKKLLLLKNDDVEFAALVQKILRNYLEVRFDEPFTRAVSSAVYELYLRATNGLLSEEKNSAVEEMQRVFIRTDFIRYAQGSELNGKAEFFEGERSQIVEGLLKNIAVIEKVEKVSGEAADA